MRFRPFSLLRLVFLLAVTSVASAATWYVNGVSGSNANNCLSASTACKTIGHAISLATSGDTIRVAAAIYVENLNIGKSLTMTGTGASTTIVDGGSVTTVVTIPSGGAIVTLSKLTIRNGSTTSGNTPGSGIVNSGVLTIAAVHVTGNRSCIGGGIQNLGVLTVNESTISGDSVFQAGLCDSLGAGIANSGRAVINNSTISGNSATGAYGPRGGGILNWRMGTLTVNNSTIIGNKLPEKGTFAGTKGGAIFNFESGTVRINSSTISANGAEFGGNLYNIDGTVTIQNSIVANSTAGGNCNGTMASKGYNLSSDTTCDFDSAGDRNDINPMLDPLANNGGSTQTMALPSASPAIDAGNPSGCTDGLGHLLKTDQRGLPRPDKEDTGGCDVGAYERQSD